MKLFSIIAAATLVSGSLLAGNGTHQKAVAYKVDTKASKIAWEGKKVTGSHNGAVNFESGQILTDGKALTGGDFVVDLKTITNEDIKDASVNAKFMGHMASPDFFDINNHPKATFKITNVKKTGVNTYDVTGDLTIKGVTKPQTFPATVDVKAKELTAKGTLKVDRTAYDIKYGSGKFFENLGDKMINDDFTLDFNLVAKK